MSFEINVLLKTTTILLCVGGLAWLLKHSSAAARHAAWAVGLVSVLAFPFMSRVLPSVDLPLLPITESARPAEAPVEGPVEAIEERLAAEIAPTKASVIAENEKPLSLSPTAFHASEVSALHRTSAEVGTPATSVNSPSAASRWSFKSWIALVWVMGTVLVFAGWICALISLRRLTRNSGEITDTDWITTLTELQRDLSISDRVQLRIIEAATPPMTWGLFRHVILLPADAREWTAIRRRLVLAHELAHIKRVDGLGHILAQCVCSFYWFNPVVWYAVHRLQIERERACDDYVLRLGASAIDYADHLLQIARGLNSRFALPAISMAQPSQLKYRMVAILDPQTRRQTLSRAGSAALLFLVAILTLSTAAIQVTAVASLVLPEASVPPLPFLTVPPEAPAQAQAQVPATPQAAPATGPLSIEGRVLDATTAEPLSDVDISLPQANGTTRVAATTDNEGRFTIEGLAAGSYPLTTNKEGYARLRAENRSVPGNPGVWITVQAGQSLKNVVLRLHKSAVVTGRVFDTQASPVSGGEVTLVRTSYDRYGQREFTSLGTAATNDRGEFRAFGLEAGEYYLRVRPDNEPFRPPPGGETFAEAFYPGVSDISKATLIKLDWGAEFRLGDTIVQPVKTVPLRMKIVNESGEPERGIRSFALYRDGQLITGITSSPNLSGGPGRFELLGLTPGTYDIAVGWGGNDKMAGARKTVELAGKEVTGDLVVRKAPTVSGRFLLQEADGTLRPIAASLRLEKAGFQLLGAGDAEGNFSIPAVPEEEYWTRFGRLPAGAYTLSMRQDGAVVRADQVRISRDTKLEIVFASASGIVEGSVRNSKGEKIANASVAVLPDAPLGDHGHLYRTGTTDQNGNFAISGVPPGSYHAFAWNDLEGAAYRNAEFMKRFEERGSGIAVKANATAKTELRLADEVLGPSPEIDRR
jgi:beta-lactamase regulating signal transducer with metallopeptidase domain/protocatechuate 3,4-dioxygenase beta subunit